MFLYFHVLDRDFFRETMVPALSESRRRRTFDSCQELCRKICARTAAPPEDALLRQVAQGLTFTIDFWHGLIGECLVHGADELPRVQTDPIALTCLLAPEQFSAGDVPREHFAPIQQAHFGTRDLRFGAGFYRPDHAGWNDADDIARLVAYLETIDPSTWTPSGLGALKGLDDTERAEVVADLQAWWPDFVALYRSARDQGQIIVCERM